MSASWSLWPTRVRAAGIRLGLAVGITWSTAAGCLMELSSRVSAQNPAGIPSQSDPTLSFVALEQIQEDYVDFLNERKRLHDEYEQTIDTLSNTELPQRNRRTRTRSTDGCGHASLHPREILATLS